MDMDWLHNNQERYGVYLRQLRLKKRKTKRKIEETKLILAGYTKQLAEIETEAAEITRLDAELEWMYRCL